MTTVQNCELYGMIRVYNKETEPSPTMWTPTMSPLHCTMSARGNISSFHSRKLLLTSLE